ncbi:hypothetical protein NOCA1170105 [metagenome]|uniref:Uncharacterized protein n=1 Tax=metagenome TaxID=256318 RepID=A0A2P2CB14_9ZZZZ
MSMRRKHKSDLGILELAVDPAAAERRNHPVRIRLTRPLTPWEVEGLAVVVPGVRAEGDCVVVPDARLEDVAREHEQWLTRLERAQSIGDELEGESWVADHHRVDRQTRLGSHMRSQQADDRGMH